VSSLKGLFKAKAEKPRDIVSPVMELDGFPSMLFIGQRAQIEICEDVLEDL
jgi:hypothetical protein